MQHGYNERPYRRRFRPRERTAAALGGDARIARTVAGALSGDPAVTGGRVQLSVQNGVVILDGEVDTESTRRAVVAAAWAVAGVIDVCDALAVAPGTGMEVPP